MDEANTRRLLGVLAIGMRDDETGDCMYCGVYQTILSIEHKGDCPVLAAREVLGLTAREAAVMSMKDGRVHFGYDDIAVALDTSAGNAREYYERAKGKIEGRSREADQL